MIGSRNTEHSSPVKWGNKYCREARNYWETSPRLFRWGQTLTWPNQSYNSHIIMSLGQFLDGVFIEWYNLDSLGEGTCGGQVNESLREYLGGQDCWEGSRWKDDLHFHWKVGLSWELGGAPEPLLSPPGDVSHRERPVGAVPVFMVM